MEDFIFGASVETGHRMQLCKPYGMDDHASSQLSADGSTDLDHINVLSIMSTYSYVPASRWQICDPPESVLIHNGGVLAERALVNISNAVKRPSESHPPTAYIRVPGKQSYFAVLFRATDVHNDVAGKSHTSVRIGFSSSNTKTAAADEDEWYLQSNSFDCTYTKLSSSTFARTRPNDAVTVSENIIVLSRPFVEGDFVVISLDFQGRGEVLYIVRLNGIEIHKEVLHIRGAYLDYRYLATFGFDYELHLCPDLSALNLPMIGQWDEKAEGSRVAVADRGPCALPCSAIKEREGVIRLMSALARVGRRMYNEQGIEVHYELKCCERVISS